ncbi:MULTISPECIES: transposase [unclassified Marinobacterium]|jgi:putative transposase|uniref:REP-associated tyrosine transposase n=1 Tax=unclassified Marinobacterium TaxID=2644139 RepID=UPI0015693CA2|nr:MULTISPECIES: transposase [unclassified Marinobacterium]NRP10826.1 Transposase IS200 like protein [Marinobacterium sp. xm-g-48]NRP14894.1 Transposase IS200 like protein [Marinobacterium sp. xm-a-152]NRP27402.1 Transposase IS200 like protein [Marinobacterium sp. xm-d-420]NRP36748.1 Transposase IS200 like protein [Marinobacterium sp. xm-d-579]NRP46647.1 Transposase IS200 like protein [Marinobacterium sp. xm-d-543]
MIKKPGYSSLRKGRVSIPGQIYHLTTVTLGRQCFFEDFHVARSLVKCLHSQQIESLAYVIMPDHFHWLIQLNEHSGSISHVMRKVKLSLVKGQGISWEKGFYDRAIRRSDDIESIARYIVMNPVRAGLVTTVREYPHWDAIWLD